MTAYPQGTARAVLWTASAALVLRLLYFAEHARSAFFGVAILDEAYYDGAARAIGSGDAAAALADGFRPPLYPLLLAMLYRLGSWVGPELEVATAIAAQHLLGVGTTALVVLLGARLSDRAAVGALAGVLYAAAGPPLFFEGERLIVTLFTFLVTLGLVLAGAAAAAPRRTSTWLAIGLTVGLAVQARANGLLLAAPALLAAALVPPPGHRRRALAGTLLGLAAVALAFSALRLAAGGPFQLLPSAGGVNLYLGNERGADGMVPRQDRPVTYGETYRDSVAVFAEQEFLLARSRGEVEGAATPSRIGRYWTRRALAEIAADPLGRLRLLGRKCVLLLADVEIPNNKRFAWIAAHESPLLARLPVRWLLLLTLAPFGVAALWRLGDRILLLWMAASVTVLAAGIVLFFVNGRYRIPLWPAMACLAAAGAIHLGEALAARSFRRIAPAAATAAVLAAVSFTVGARLELPGAGRDVFFRSLAHLEKGSVEAAFADAELAVAAMPDDGAAWLQLGNVELAAERPRRAVEAFRRAQQLRPDEPRIVNNLGVALDSLEQPAEAYRSYLQAIRLEPDYPPPWINAALLELRAGAVVGAARRLAHADALGFRSPQRTAAEALVHEARGELAMARALLDTVPADQQPLVRKVIADARRPLDPAQLGLAPPAGAGDAPTGAPP